MCTVGNSKRVTLATVVVMLLYNIQWFFTISSRSTRVGCRVSFRFQRPLRSFVVFFIPAVVMMLCNIAIIVKLLKKREVPGTAVKAAKAAKQATTMLLCTTSLFVLSTFPLQVYLFLTEQGTRKMIYVTIVVNMFNHSINVLLYLLSGSKYREGVRKMFRI